MLEIFDRDRKRVAIAENACDISEDRWINAIWYLNFSLPCNDSKNQYCLPFHYARLDGGELYRIMPAARQVTETGLVAYQCEHVLATLIDKVMFGYHVVGNRGVYTGECIEYVLAHQSDWVLYECDFRRQFEYGWEQETLLSALFSIATPLSGYLWVTDTSVYPWRLSLKALDQAGPPQFYIRHRWNMLSYGDNTDPQQICTRLYPLGYGEGVNQLGIESVNGGVPYLQSPNAITDRYGIVERVWIDRRYEDPESLKAAAQIMLEQLQEPLRQYEIGFAELDVGDYGKAEIGRRVRIMHPELGEQIDTYITELRIQKGDVDKSTLTVANRSTSIASDVADMMDRQRIEQAYAQGATQLYAQSLQANCDADNGAVMNFYIPSDMRIINKVMAKVRMGQFRSYSKATERLEQSSQTSSSGGSSTQSSSSGGGGTQTSSSGGGGSQTSSSGGGGSQTSSSTILSAENILPQDSTTYGSATHNHGIPQNTRIAIYGGTGSNGEVISGSSNGRNYIDWTPSGAHSHGAHDHEISIPSHTHSVSIPSHSHSVTIPEHTHSVTIPAHTHSITIPAHDHQITPGIFFSGSPQTFGLYVNDVFRASFSGSSAEIDVTDYLIDPDDNLIPRGSWLSLEIRPDDLAYVSIDMFVQGFVQSRGDKTV